MPTFMIMPPCGGSGSPRHAPGHGSPSIPQARTLEGGERYPGRRVTIPDNSIATGSLSPGPAEDAMAKIKHIALSTQDPDKTARFYIDVFGMKEIAKIDSPNARGFYLSDGDLNLAILKFKNDQAAGVERGKGWSGIHHIGFQVESMEEISVRLAASGAVPRHNINEALGVGPGHDHRQGNVEVKYVGT